ncbi:MAG: thiamine pyrophosphate-dependent enzyme [Hyphomicrobiaceae bacterium]
MTKRLDRRAAVRRLVEPRQDTLLISGLGSPTYDVAAVGDHPRNFYLWGAMGGAAMMGLGVALAQPSTPVLVLTGDGDMLMGIGSFATIALKAPRNLAIVVLDNGIYGETGGQPTATSGGADLAAIARASGIPETSTVDSLEALDPLARRLHRLGDGPCVAVVKIKPDPVPRVMTLKDAHHNQVRFRAALGFVPG